MTDPAAITIEVACALPERQQIIELQVPVGTRVRSAVELANIQREFPELDIATSALGIFGTVVTDDYTLGEGDRIEIYRPLVNEPRDARRALAARGATMGRRGGAAD